MSIVELMEAETLPPRLAALLWLGMERGASVLVAAEPPLAGKTTLLTALLALAPRDALGYFTRGIGETFDLPRREGSRPCYLLINEISDHLPIYTWGPYARRAFELLAQGYSLASTMHADSVAEVIQVLAGELGIPRRHIGHLTFILVLRLYWGAGRLLRRVDEVAFLQPRGDDLALHRPLEGDEEALARWAGLPSGELLGELARREGYLLGLLERGVRDIRAVEEAVARYPGRGP